MARVAVRARATVPDRRRARRRRRRRHGRDTRRPRRTSAIAAMRAGKRRARRQARRRRASNSSTRCAPRRRKPGRVYSSSSPNGSTTTAMVRAYEPRPGRAGIGTVMHTVGLGPHTLNLKQRPEWFFDPRAVRRHPRRHRLTPGRPVPRVHRRGATPTCSRRRSRSHPEHPGVEVLGEMLLAADGATGYARVDYFTPKGLAPAWGDVRFTVVGHRRLPRGAPRRADRDRSSTANGARSSTARARPPAGATRYLAGTLFDAGARVRGLGDLPRCAAARPSRPTAGADRGGLTGALSKGSLDLLDLDRTTTARSPRDRLPLRSRERQDGAGRGAVGCERRRGGRANGAVPALNCGGCHRMLERLVREHITPRRPRRSP